MNIRPAEQKDIRDLLRLLSQVLEVHAKIRPDIFRSGTTKYTEEDLTKMIQDDKKPIYVAEDENEGVLGYAFCQEKEQPFSTTMVPFKSFFIDDLCVDETKRGQHVGKALFEYVKEEAKARGCYELTLNVWEGNDVAQHFYENLGMTTKERQLELIL